MRPAPARHIVVVLRHSAQSHMSADAEGMTITCPILFWTGVTMGPDHNQACIDEVTRESLACLQLTYDSNNSCLGSGAVSEGAELGASTHKAKEDWLHCSMP